MFRGMKSSCTAAIRAMPGLFASASRRVHDGARVASIRAVENAIGAYRRFNARSDAQLIIAARSTSKTTSSISITCTRSTGSMPSRRDGRPGRDLAAREDDLGLAELERAPTSRDPRRGRGFAIWSSRACLRTATGAIPRISVSRGQPDGWSRIISRRSIGRREIVGCTRSSAARIRTRRRSWSAAWRHRSIRTRKRRSTSTQSRRCAS